MQVLHKSKEDLIISLFKLTKDICYKSLMCLQRGRFRGDHPEMVLDKDQVLFYVVVVLG